MFKLVIEDDEGNKTVVPVIRDEISIGRQEGNTIRLTERNVSRRHGRLLRNKDNTIVFEELDARYGTRKNGEKIAGRADFTMGDVFLVGDYRLTLQGETPPEAKTEAPKPNTTPAPPPPSLPKPQGGFSNQPTQITRREDIEKRSGVTELIPSAPAKIVVVSSNFAGQEFPLTHKEMVIGRGEEADIIVDHRSVSQAHAKIVREAAGTYKIVDLNSKNGIKVSGEEYKAVHLKRGDIIELGHVKFRFVEPNENYVFTPQSIIDDDESFAAPPKSNKTALMGGLGVLVLLAIVVIGYAGMQMQKKGTDVAVTTPPDVTEPTATSVEPQLAKAEEELNAGNADRAIVVLELARDTMSPNAEEKTRISEMLSQARREKPLEAALKESRASYNDKRYVDALRRLKSIPPDDSIIAKLVKEEGLVESSIEQILSQARAAIQEGDVEEANSLIEEVLIFDAEHPAALALQSEAKVAKPTEVAVAVKKPVETKTTTKTTTKTSTPTVNKRPAMTEEERAEIVQQARQAMFSGNNAKAIDLCKNIRHADCYRVLGVAYKNMGQMPKACENFKKAGQQVPECE